MRTIARLSQAPIQFLRSIRFTASRFSESTTESLEPRPPSECRGFLRPTAFASFFLLAVLVFLAAPVTKHGSAKTAPNPTQHHWYQIGRASWYGRALQGQPTASGQAFNMHGMTCAHRTLPLGSLVRVTNLSNQKSVVVLVNDRGPQVQSRIVDLSYAAARALGFRGTAHVRLQIVDRTPTPEEVASLTAVDENHQKQNSPVWK